MAFFFFKQGFIWFFFCCCSFAFPAAVGKSLILSNSELGASATEALSPPFPCLFVCLGASLAVPAEFLERGFVFFSYVVLPLLTPQQQDTERFGFCAGKWGKTGNVWNSNGQQLWVIVWDTQKKKNKKNSQSLGNPKQNYLCLIQSLSIR